MRDVPKLRFPEFSDSWISSLIGDNLKKVIDYRGKAPPKTESGVFLITARNVRLGFIDFASKEYIDESLYAEWMNRGLPEPNDVCFTTEAPLGNVCLFPETGRFALGQRIITLQTKIDELYSKFLYQFLLSPVGRKKVLIRGTGSTAKGIKSKLFVKIPIEKPSLPEQGKIADFLGAVDDKIAGLRERESLLTQYKKGVMQKIFSQALRFQADDGSDFPDWEDTSIKNVCSVDWGNTSLTKSSYEPAGEYLAVSASGGDGRISFAEYSGSTPVLSAIGALCGKMFFPKEPFTAIKNTMVFHGSENSKFLFYLLSRFKFPIQGAGQPFIGKRDVEKSIIQMPCSDEQQKIADFLSAIDAKITAASAQISQMQDFKKGLLQQMFV